MSDDTARAWDELRDELRARARAWLVTGGAGFIGSHLTETLLGLGQSVRVVDDFSTGHRRNFELVRARVGEANWSRFELVEADICDAERMAEACRDIDHVLHQAAIGSVPRSIEDPLTTFRANVEGSFRMLEAAREAGVRSLVAASSSSVYGDHPELPKVEAQVGQVLSPYAASKAALESHLTAWTQAMKLPTVALRYFNVVGSRQDPAGQYAAVVPRWIATLAQGEAPIIFGDGETSRDFCPVDNVVQANLLAAFAPEAAHGRAFNVALGGRTTLNELFVILREGMAARGIDCAETQARYEDFRAGDIRHSHADISAAREALGYRPTVSVAEALGAAMDAHLLELQGESGADA